MNAILDIHVGLCDNSHYIVYFRERNKFIEEVEVLQDPSTLTCNSGQLCCMLTVVSAGLLRVSSRLLESFSTSAFTILEFAMLHSDVTCCK